MEKLNSFQAFLLIVLAIVSACYVADCWRDAECAKAGLVQQEVGAQVVWVKPTTLPAEKK